MARITFAHLCDRVSISPNGKPNFEGVFSAVFAHTFPAIHSQAFLVFEVERSYAEFAQEHSIDIQFVDADGDVQLTTTVPLSSEAAPGFKPKPGARPRSGMVVPLPPLPLPVAGSYDFNLFLRGDLLHSVSLEAVQIKPEAA